MSVTAEAMRLLARACPFPLAPGTVWCGPTSKAAHMRVVLRKLFVNDINERCDTPMRYPHVNISELCLDEISLSSDSQNGSRCDLYKMETCIDTNNETSVIRVKTIEGLSDEEKRESMSRWVKIMSELSMKEKCKTGFF